MRIFMLCDFFNEELEYQENHLVDYYRRPGHEVIVVCSLYENVFDYYTDKKVGGPGRDYEVNGARIVKLPYRYNILNRMRAYPKIDGLLEEFEPAKKTFRAASAKGDEMEVDAIVKGQWEAFGDSQDCESFFHRQA